MRNLRFEPKPLQINVLDSYQLRCTQWAKKAFLYWECSGCFGCCVKPTPIIAVDEPAKGLRIQGQTMRKPSASDGFWSSSPCDLDNSTIQSQRSLLLWNESRLQWVGRGLSEKQSQQKQESRLNRNATYESLLGTRQPFPKSVPLSEMVEFLVDVWESEGMYG
ncbi:hypothetical protein L195_g010821 [Trifolium pratense]|uniref:Gag1-like clamp domain-containing protein n=1 Tax=Trifolium pratense TaxID=57577 RepID=A0A2K3PFS2_TRIPR|nr:hypothetical protein L195_g010821 [Trifolium pratense]